MASVEKLHEEEVMRWVRTPGNQIYRYQMQPPAIAFLLGLFFVSTISAGIFAWGDIDNASTYSGISTGFAAWTLFKLARTFYTLSRKLIGISPTELLLVENNSATRIPFKSIRENGFTDADKVLTTKDYIKIRADERSFKITTMNPFLQLENLPEFLSTLLEKTEPPFEPEK